MFFYQNELIYIIFRCSISNICILGLIMLFDKKFVYKIKDIYKELENCDNNLSYKHSIFSNDYYYKTKLFDSNASKKSIPYSYNFFIFNLHLIEGNTINDVKSCFLEKPLENILFQLNVLPFPKKNLMHYIFNPKRKHISLDYVAEKILQLKNEHILEIEKGFYFINPNFLEHETIFYYPINVIGLLNYFKLFNDKDKTIEELKVINIYFEFSDDLKFCRIIYDLKWQDSILPITLDPETFEFKVIYHRNEKEINSNCSIFSNDFNVYKNEILSKKLATFTFKN